MYLQYLFHQYKDAFLTTNRERAEDSVKAVWNMLESITRDEKVTPEEVDTFLPEFYGLVLILIEGEANARFEEALLNLSEADQATARSLRAQLETTDNEDIASQLQELIHIDLRKTTLYGDDLASEFFDI